MRATLCRYATFSLLLAAVPAQGPAHVVPKELMFREANSRHWIPSHAAPARAQTTYHPDQLTEVPTGNIDRLWLRPDGDALTYEAHRFVVTLHMASTGLPLPDQVDPESFAANRGTDRRMVLNRQIVDFPAHTGTGPSSTPQNWNVTIPIQPFPYVAGRGLQVEWDVESTGSNREFPVWFVDAYQFHHAATSGSFGRDNERNACPDRNTVHGGLVGGPGERASVWWYSGGAAGLPATMFFGTQSETWAGSSLPFDLDFLGATGCKVWTDLAWGLGGVTDDNGGPGRFRVNLVLPPDPQLARARFYAQTFVADPSAPGGMRASDRARIQLGSMPAPFYGARHLYSYQGALNDIPEFMTEHGIVLGIN